MITPKPAPSSDIIDDEYDITKFIRDDEIPNVSNYEAYNNFAFFEDTAKYENAIGKLKLLNGKIIFSSDNREIVIDISQIKSYQRHFDDYGRCIQVWRKGKLLWDNFYTPNSEQWEWLLKCAIAGNYHRAIPMNPSIY